MTTLLTFTEKKIPGYPVGKASRFPALRDPIKSTIESRLSEKEGLFINYGMFSDSLPYSMQDDYDIAEKQSLTFRSAVLENDFLRAEFILDLGGRMWSLTDKLTGCDLVTNNREFIPGNLAIRNAWFAGGVEWNCGRRGHDANTCSPRFAAELNDPDYGPVLRIYDYSRDRKTPYQLDFFLPEKSHFLFSRVRIVNPYGEVIPMYWWSNIAVPITPGCRVVVPAMETYLNKYDAGSHFITKTTMPSGEGFDQTYPENFKIVRDHFYAIPDHSRKYECLFQKNGYGFSHCSTRRLQGRKLFVWGDTAVGRHWQRKLLSEGLNDYLELQAGLAKTQQECLPMPPNTVWEWLEAYGAVQEDPQDIFGEWSHAVQAVTKRLDQELPEDQLERILAETERFAVQKGNLRCSGSGSAALEEMRSGEKLCSHLDYGNPGPTESDWLSLLQTGTMSTETEPQSFSVDPEWIPRLKQMPDCWKKWYYLALPYFRRKDWEQASDCSERALELRRNAWTLQLRANILIQTGESSDKYLPLLEEAILLPEADAYLVKECLKLMTINHDWSRVLSVYPRLRQEDQRRPMVQLQKAAALAGTGKLEEAEAILTAGGGLELPDAREGDVSITSLYVQIKKEKLRRAGKDPESFREEEIPFRINYNTK